MRGMLGHLPRGFVLGVHRGQTAAVPGFQKDGRGIP